MVGNEFVVVKCNLCEHHTGKNRSSKSTNCTRCGNILGESSSIIEVAADGSELQSLVAYHNMPENLRGDFRKMLRKSEKIDFNNTDDFSSNIDSKMLTLILLESAKDNDILTSKSLTAILRSKKMNLSAEEVIGIAEYEGFLLRLEHDKWKIID